MVTYPLVTALVKAEEFLGVHRTWRAMNNLQTRFLTEIFAPCRAEGMKIPEIESVASKNIDEVNAFLLQRGFGIQLEPAGPDSFAMASVLKLFVEWAQVGSETQIKDHTKTWYPAVQLVTGVMYYRSKGHHHPIAALATKAGDVVYLTMLDKASNGFDLISRAEQLNRFLCPVNEFAGVTFPMVDLRQEVDVQWLLHMTTTDMHGRLTIIEQALQQTMLQMNEVGASAKSVFAGVSLGCQVPAPETRPDMVINRAFLVWFLRQGLSKPLFVGYIAQENWKKPESIS
jgi:hypothetical protein